MRLRKQAWTFVAAGAALVGQAGAPSAPAGAATLGCGATVTTSVTLTADIGPCPDTALVVTANGVTLDLAGHTVRGDGNPATTPDQVGILLRFVSNVVVKNGTARDFNAGVVISQGGGNTIQDMTVTNNVGTATSAHGDGIFLFASNDNKLLRNRVTSNGPDSGITLGDGSSRNLISASLIADNNIPYPAGPESGPAQLDVGVNFTGAAADNVIDGNQILRNGFFGLGAAINATRRRVVNNVVRDNGVMGINTGGAGGDLVANNVVDHNGFDAFRLPSQPSDFGLTGGIVMCGRCLVPGPPSTFERNVVTNNKGFGIGLLFNWFQCCDQPPQDQVRPNVVRYNSVRQNTGDGIYVECDETFAPWPFVAGVTTVQCVNAPPHPGQQVYSNAVTGNGGAGAGITAWDLHDGNADCDDNSWFQNQAQTFMPACTKGT